jgi:hypothetical protein
VLHREDMVSALAFGVAHEPTMHKQKHRERKLMIASWESLIVVVRNFPAEVTNVLDSEWSPF